VKGAAVFFILLRISSQGYCKKQNKFHKKGDLIIMLHPSYTDLMAVVNSEVEPGEQPVVNSRYSIVLATAKRAREIIDGQEPLVAADPTKKPLSVAVEELYDGKVKIVGADED
jgi:DNA-directed RNA polymerase subunit omega